MRFARFAAIGLLVAACLTTVWAAEFRLANGNTLVGEIASADEDGMVVRLAIGGFSTRQPWVSFSQETLRELAKDPSYAEFVEPFIELTPEEWQMREQRREIIVREVMNRIPLPDPMPSFFGAFLAPGGLLLLVLLLAGNLYAAYEIALFRGHNPLAVCAVSFVLPLVGPIIFLSLPASVPEEEEPAPAAAELADSSPLSGAVERSAGGLSLASADKPVVATAETQSQTYQRGEHTFNRRFFESKFPGFFRVVLGDAERDMLLVFRTPKQEYVGKRISRISMKELHLVLQSNNSETSIPFSEITSVIVKHKDAKA
jgi:hypothetical protein